MSVLKEDTLQFSFHPTNEFVKIMENSFKFWHKKYVDSMINYSLVWKKALESDSQILQKMKEFQNNSKYDSDVIIEQFFEMWAYGIRETNFETALTTIKNWKEFWKNLTGEQFRMCSEILQMVEKYWENIQRKNIE